MMAIRFRFVTEIPILNNGSDQIQRLKNPFQTRRDEMIKHINPVMSSGVFRLTFWNGPFPIEGVPG